MTLDEMRECVLDGIPFVVFGEAMRFSSAETGWTDPHAWYRHHIGQGRIAVETESEQEHNALLRKTLAELAAYKAESIAAREWIDTLTKLAYSRESDTYINGKDAYLAARVKDGE